MARLLTIAIVCGLTTLASASVQIFMTAASQGYGLTDPSEALQVTRGNGLDLTPLNAPIFPPEYQALATAAPGELVYVWLRFNGEPGGRRIQGLSLSPTGWPLPAAMAFYKLDDTADTGQYGSIRWESAPWQLDGIFDWTGPGPPPVNPRPVAHMVGIQTQGITNGASSADPCFDPATRIALLGALRYDSPSPNGDPYGLGFADGFDEIEYAGSFPNPVAEWGELVVTPEPAGLVLSILALVRRGLIGRPKQFAPMGVGAVRPI